MPTGYTARIADGISFKEFAFDCSRAFGALISMRDESRDTPIPDEIKPRDYHIINLEKIKKEIADINSFSKAQIKKQIEKEYKEEIKYLDKHIKGKKGLNSKYEKMLREVKKWKIPTKDHQEFKNFMIKQLTNGINCDCDVEYFKYEKKKLKKETPEKWKQQKLDKLNENLSYHSKQWEEEVQRCKERTEWIQQLKKSLS